MNEGQAYSEILQLRRSQCDLAGRLTLAQMFLFMQEIAGEGSDRLGMGQKFVDDNRIFWVVSRVALKVLRPPEWHEKIRITTWHGPAMRYIFPRYFIVDDMQGNRLVEASTLWLLIEHENRSIVFPSMRGFLLPDPPGDMPKLASPGKMSFAFEPSRHAVRRPVYSDFDMNGHMNNSRYPLWICDLFEPEQFVENYVDSFQVNYINEVIAGEQVDLSYGVENNAFAVRGSVEGESRFEAVGTFAPYACHE